MGGYSVPKALFEGTKNSRYASGSFDLLPGSNQWIANHGVSGYIIEYIEPGAPSMGFPELIVGRKAHPFKPVRKISAAGVQWLDEKRVICSGRKSYRSGPEKKWVSVVNLHTGQEELISVGLPEWDENSKELFHLHQAFGGGFMRIPEEWANEHVGGRTIGMAAGGYDVLGSPLGPAAAAFRIGDELPVTLLDFPMSNPSIRDPEYKHPSSKSQLSMWKSAEGDIGYWQGDTVSNGAAWVKHEKFKGVIWGCLFARGYIDYRAQGDYGSGKLFLVADPAVFYNPETGGGNRGDHKSETQFADGPKGKYGRVLYTYDPDQLAEVVSGRRQPWECEAVRSEFDFTGITISEQARGPSQISGLHWDDDRKLLWVTISKAIDNKWSILAAYELKTEDLDDMDSNTDSSTDPQAMNLIGYPADATVNAAVNGTRVDVTWEEIDEAAFYRLEIHDMDGSHLHSMHTTQNSYVIPAGYLKEHTAYQYRITASREFSDQGIDNSAKSMMKVFETASNQEMNFHSIILTDAD